MDIQAGSIIDMASIIAAFGSAMILFRVQREAQMEAKQETVWLPWADALLIAATLVSLLLVILPVLLNVPLAYPAGAIAFACVAVAGYIPSILAHYRVYFGSGRSGPRDNPEPMERVFVIATVLLGVAAGIWVFLQRSVV